MLGNKKLVNVNLNQLKTKDMISASTKDLIMINQSRKTPCNVNTMPMGSLEASFENESASALEKSKKSLPA